VRCPPLERDGGSLEGYRGWRFEGSLRIFGPWAFLALGCSRAGRDLVCSIINLLGRGDVPHC
jgi:hypothetical protein